MNSLSTFISEFPESLYQYSLENKEEYIGRVISGLSKMADSSVIICGVARDVEENFPYTIARIERLGNLFKSCCVYIYENDSIDDTKKIIKTWSQENYKNRRGASVFCEFEDLGFSHEVDKEHERTIRMAFCRNKYIKWISLCDINADYVIILDTDILGGWSYHGVANSFGYDYDVVGSNGLLYKDKARLMFDSWAFRALGHEEEHNPVDTNLRSYNRGEAPFEVSSCFGGLAIYKREVLENVKYLSGDCDHPTLHKQIRENGYKIYLNPSQIVLHNRTQYCL